MNGTSVFVKNPHRDRWQEHKHKQFSERIWSQNLCLEISQFVLEGLIICLWHLYLIAQQNLGAEIFVWGSRNLCLTSISYSSTKSSRQNLFLFTKKFLHGNLCVKMKTKKFPYMVKSFFYYTFCSRFRVWLSFHENKKVGKRISVKCDFCSTIHVLPFSLKLWNNVTWFLFRLWPLIAVSLTSEVRNL